MLEVTDMILNVDKLKLPGELPEIELHEATGSETDLVVKFIALEFPNFSRFYEAPKPKSSVCSVTVKEELVGAVLIEEAPEAAERSTDAALACLVIAEERRCKGFGSAAIYACCEEISKRGFTRVIAEWVASPALYVPLGFEFWKTRMVADGPA